MEEKDSESLAGPLTTPGFWNGFWDGLELPTTIDLSNAFERAFVPVLDRFVPRGSRVVEVGCAPGRWLAHCASAYGARPTGFELSPDGAAATRANLELLRVDSTIIEADFLTADLPRGEFDVVLSLGFLEHFTDADLVFRRHVELLAPGGHLILEVPNLRGVNSALMARSDPELLALHNQAVMDPGVFRGLGARNGLTLLEIGYLGGFDPTLFDTAQLALPWRILVGVARRARRRPRVAGVDHRLLSGYLYGVFRRPTGTTESRDGPR